MADTKIDWADKVWNPVTGCTKVSDGCSYCYAEGIAKRFWGDRPFSQIEAYQEKVDLPHKWKKPQKIFVNSMGDLFHEDVSFVTLMRIWATMATTPRHTYLILTKRPQRVLEFYQWLKNNRAIGEFTVEFTLPNLWLGVSVENQETATQRIPILLKIPAEVRFVSCEPLLGPVNLHEYYQECGNGCYDLWIDLIDWVIVGGETGPKARPMHPDWAKSLLKQCQIKEKPFFFKGWGEWTTIYPQGLSMGNRKMSYQHNETFYRVGKKHSGNMLNEISYQQFPEVD